MPKNRLINIHSSLYAYKAANSLQHFKTFYFISSSLVFICSFDLVLVKTITKNNSNIANNIQDCLSCEREREKYENNCEQANRYL